MIDLKEFKPSNHVKTAATCLLSISSSLMGPEHSDACVKSLIACSSVLTYDYMQQHEITIEDIKALLDNETVNFVIGEVYNSISRDIDQLRANLEA